MKLEVGVVSLHLKKLFPQLKNVSLFSSLSLSLSDIFHLPKPKIKASNLFKAFKKLGASNV